MLSWLSPSLYHKVEIIFRPFLRDTAIDLRCISSVSLQVWKNYKIALRFVENRRNHVGTTRKVSCATLVGRVSITRHYNPTRMFLLSHFRGWEKNNISLNLLVSRDVLCFLISVHWYINHSVLFVDNKFPIWLAVQRKNSKEIESICELLRGAPSLEDTSTMTLLYVVFIFICRPNLHSSIYVPKSCNMLMIISLRAYCVIMIFVHIWALKFSERWK
jgi:hypothetical protein